MLNLVMEWIPGQQVVLLMMGSMLFGLAQISRDKHGLKAPNWRFMVTATVYGSVCGTAQQRTGRVTVSAHGHAI